MESCGFINVVEQQLMKSEVSELKGLENIRRMPKGFLELESIVLEASKP